MNADRLLALYDRVADAPDAIARLRRLVRNLAVRGKLMEQEPGEEPASELLKRIATEKKRLANAGEITKFKERQPASLADLPFSIPSHWQPAKIEQVLNELQTGPFGSSLHKSDYRKGGTPVINPASIQAELIVPIEKMAVDHSTLERLASFKLRSGDIVMARRGEMGRCAVVNEREAGWLCGTGSLVLRPSKLMFARFLVLLIGSPFGREYLGGTAVGSTMQNLNQSILADFPIGLPPLAEQHRIVAKVDELMALCGRLEAARAHREATRDRLTAASLARLSTPDADAETFRTHARFTLDTLPALTTRPDQIKALRQTILNLAVRGALVEQMLGEVAPIKQLKCLKAEREILVSERKLRKVAAVAPLSDEAPFSIPENWSWTFPDDISSLTNNALTIGPFGSNLIKADYRTEGIPLVFVADIRAEFQLLPRQFISRLKAEELQGHSTGPGDLLLTKMGDPPGDTAIYPEDRPRAVITADCIKWTLQQELVDVRFLYFAFRSPLLARQITGITKGAVHQKISLKRFRGVSIPLPPLAEQHRIVAKVDALMALCDQLEKNLAAADTARRSLLEALLHEALAPTTEALEAA